MPKLAEPERCTRLVVDAANRFDPYGLVREARGLAPLIDYLVEVGNRETTPAASSLQGGI